MADQEQIWKLKSIRLRLRIKRSADRRVGVDRDLIELDSIPLKRFDALRHRKLRRQLHRTVFAPAHAFEDECGQIAIHFFEAGAIPIAKIASFIKERYRAPLPFAIDKF